MFLERKVKKIIIDSRSEVPEHFSNTVSASFKNSF